MPQAYWIIPLESGGQIDNTLPGGPPVYPSGGPVRPGGPIDPSYGRPGWERPDYIWGQRPPHVGGGPAYGGGYPSGQPVPPPTEPPAGGTDVPPDQYAPPPPPEDISSQYIASVWDPRTMTWTTKSYPPQ